MSVSELTITASINDARSICSQTPSLYSISDIPASIPASITSKIVKYRNNQYLDWVSNRWRILFFILLVVFCILIFSPLWTRNYDDLALHGTVIHDAVYGKHICLVMHTLLAIIIPSSVDTFIDLLQFRAIGVCWDIHERSAFLFMGISQPALYIYFYDSPTLPYLYVALNQSTSVILVIAVNSMISKLEQEEGKTIHGMVLCIIPCIVFGCSAVYKIYGLFDEKYGAPARTGVLLATVGLLFQVGNFLYWLSIIYTSKKKLSCLDNVEATVIVYFLVLVAFGVGTVIVNALTDGVRWRDSSEDNLVALTCLQIIVNVIIISVPTRWFRNEHIVIHETFAELTQHESIIISDDVVTITTTDNGSTVKKKINSLATVFYADIGHAITNTDLSPEILIHKLDELYTVFDYCTSLFMHQGLEMIEGETNCYMVICDEEKNHHHAETVANFAVIAKRAASLVLNFANNSQCNIKMGVHTDNIISTRLGFLSSKSHKSGKAIDIAKMIAKSSDFGSIQCSIETASMLSKSVDKPIASNLKKNYNTDKDSMPTYYILGPVTTKLSSEFILDVIDKCIAISRNKIIDDRNEGEELEEGDELI